MLGGSNKQLAPGKDSENIELYKRREKNVQEIILDIFLKARWKSYKMYTENRIHKF